VVTTCSWEEDGPTACRTQPAPDEKSKTEEASGFKLQAPGVNDKKERRQNSNLLGASLFKDSHKKSKMEKERARRGVCWR